jgi:tetratricopeptide (TPR) repeat protein
MWRILPSLALAITLRATPPVYTLVGRVVPATFVTVRLHGATSPFSAAADSDLRGHFRFTALEAGEYTLIVMQPGRGEVQRTIEIGPGAANAKGRVNTTVALDDSMEDSRHAKVSMAELSVPKDAWREYEEADKLLSHRDIAAARRHLERAVEIAPGFSAAWNHLGTIAYQTSEYPEAEGYFRKALAADPAAFEPLVNLGGVLINLGKYDEALRANLDAVRARPRNALANSQLGMAYYYTGNLDHAREYLTTAKQLDAAHFSHPQILLAEIHMRLNEPSAAADELEDLLKQHPDLKEAVKIRETIARLRAPKPETPR